MKNTIQKIRRYHFYLLLVLFCGANFQAQVTIWDGVVWDNGNPSNTLDVVFNGDYTSVGNIQAKSITVSNNATVTIASGDVVTVENSVTVTVGATLLFKNTATLLQTNAAAVNSGNITYQRNSTPIRQFEYTYWSSPVSGQVLQSFSPLTANNRFYSFDTGTNDWNTENPTSAMIAGRGYAIRVPDNYTSTPQTFNGEFTGIPNNGTVAASVVAYNPALLNYTLIGNPYPSAIGVASLIDNTTLGTLYFWTHNSAINNNVFSTNDYAIRTRNSGIAAISGGAAPGAFIAAGQGFFASSSTTGTINFTNAMRVSGNNTQFYKNLQQDASFYYMWLNMTNAGGAFKQISIGYEQGATDGYDFGIDAAPSPGTYITFYSMIGSGTYAIQGREYPWDNLDSIPLGYNVTVADTFTIALDHFDTFFDTQDIFLEDTNLATFHNLKTSPYVFTSAIGTFNNRFKIHYVNLLATTNPEAISNSVFVTKEQENISITSVAQNIQTVEIYDVVGRNLFQKKNIGNKKEIITNLKATNQPILVKIVLDNQQVVVKKLVF